MQLATLAYRDRTTAAVRDGTRWQTLPAVDLSSWFTAGALLEPGELVEGAEATLPVPAPAKVICCGLNYAEHIRETGRDVPTHPTLFAKYADSLTGPTDEVVLPSGVQVDWEAELAVVVGKPLRGVDRDTAAAGIAGFTVANDVSVRDWQRRTTQWLQGKTWDASTPLGPVIVTPDEVDPGAGLIVTCHLNGEEVQRGDTSDLVFDPASLLSYISTFTVLRPGDVVLTGTPGGVGVAREPQRFLADGDLLETEISGIGTLRNRIRLTPPDGVADGS